MTSNAFNYQFQLCVHCQEMALYESTRNGDVEGVVCALESGVCVDVLGPVSHYPYEPAKQKLSQVSAWQTDLMVVSHHQQNGWTPLMCAAWDGYIDVYSKYTTTVRSYCGQSKCSIGCG